MRDLLLSTSRKIRERTVLKPGHPEYLNPASFPNHFKPVKKMLDMSDVMIHWKRVCSTFTPERTADAAAVVCLALGNDDDGDSAFIFNTLIFSPPPFLRSRKPAFRCPQRILPVMRAQNFPPQSRRPRRTLSHLTAESPTFRRP